MHDCYDDHVFFMMRVRRDLNAIPISKLFISIIKFVYVVIRGFDGPNLLQISIILWFFYSFNLVAPTTSVCS